MNILLIANKVPFPPNDGGAFATLNMALGLKNAGAHVTVLAISTPKHPSTEQDIPQSISESIRFITTFVNTNISWVKAILNLFFSKTPYNAERFISSNFKNQIEVTLKENPFDLIQLEGLYLAPYIETIQNVSKSPIVLRAHNVEWEIWKRTAQNEKNFLKKIYLSILAQRVKRMELQALRKIDLLVPISERDKKILEQMGCSKPSYTCRTGFLLNNNVPVNNEVEFPSVFHLGGLDWIPNREGLLWFLDNCWHEIVKKIPSIKFYIAGRNATKDFINRIKKYENVEFLGEVTDSKEFMRSKAVMVVPLLSGSGMRIKIVEGMSLGKAIVSTSIGAEGIEATDGKDIMIADTANDFTAKTLFLLTNQEICSNLGSSAKEFASNNLDNSKIVMGLYNFYQNHLS
ncbi:MAG TPA: glycosyltransferase family 4 protein [Tenuifilaceae bacterium]|nr:glycosyltransferase family 4 protein [Tenuifilaceae bacterium]HRX69032.1 glycosyltransferase family 4 protein [Tenuifilaceae bacterium]